VVVICGEVVVDCVVIVEDYRTLFAGPNVGQVFQLYFALRGVVSRSLCSAGQEGILQGLKPYVVADWRGPRLKPWLT
jgi:hypothetical protein